MTLIKERAIKMIQRMPEDNMLYVINILQNLEAMSVDKEKGPDGSCRDFKYGKAAAEGF